MELSPLAASQLPPWVPLAVQGILVIVSAVFAVIAYLLKRKIEERDQEQREMRQHLHELLQLVPVLEGLKGSIESERMERKRVQEQQWSKINDVTKQLSDLGTTLSRTQTACMGTFVTQQEWSRMERLRERQDEMLNQQIRRLESQLDSVISMLQMHARMNGKR